MIHSKQESGSLNRQTQSRFGGAAVNHAEPPFQDIHMREKKNPRFARAPTSYWGANKSSDTKEPAPAQKEDCVFVYF